MAVKYSDKVMEHFMNPQNVGEIEKPDGVGEVGNPSCGDMMTFTLKVNENGRIEDVKFKTFGCGAAIAVSSMISEMAKGKTIDEALKITSKDVARELEGLPAGKMHCSNLGADALQAAIESYKKQKDGRPQKVTAGQVHEEKAASQEEERGCSPCDVSLPEGISPCKKRGCQDTG